MDGLKRQIRVLHAVGFGTLEADDQEHSPAHQQADANGHEGSAPLEALLLDKNRQLEHALTMARLRVSDATGNRPLLVKLNQQAVCVRPMRCTCDSVPFSTICMPGTKRLSRWHCLRPDHTPPVKQERSLIEGGILIRSLRDCVGDLSMTQHGVPF